MTFTIMNIFSPFRCSFCNERSRLCEKCMYRRMNSIIWWGSAAGHCWWACGTAQQFCAFLWAFWQKFMNGPWTRNSRGVSGFVSQTDPNSEIVWHAYYPMPYLTFYTNVWLSETEGYVAREFRGGLGKPIWGVTSKSKLKDFKTDFSTISQYRVRHYI